jgi:hypothetical protein
LRTRTIELTRLVLDRLSAPIQEQRSAKRPEYAITITG